jgi:hypothetical protein
MSTSNNPQTDAQSERLIKTLIEFIVSSAAEKNPKDWDEYIPALEFAYNDSVNATTGFTPFELDMGRSPNTPIKLLTFSLLGRRKYYASDEGGINPRAFLDRLSNELATARNKIHAAQLTRKERMAAGTQQVQFKPGEMVYMEHPDAHTPKHSSMDPNYVGPFRVIREVVPGVYELDLPFEYRFRHPVVNVRKLKKHYSRAKVQFADAHPRPSVPSQPLSPEVDKDNVAVPPLPPPTETVLPGPSNDVTLSDQALTTKESPNEAPLVTHDAEKGLAPDRMSNGAQMAKNIVNTDVAVLQILAKPKRGQPATSYAVAQLSELSVGSRGWCSVANAIKKYGYWHIIHDYMQNHPVQRDDHLLSFVCKVFDDGKRYCGYIVEYAPNDEFPYTIIYEDRGIETYSMTEISELLGGTIAFCNPIKRVQFHNKSVDYTFWVFPNRLAQIYARLTRPYDIDAFEHHSGFSRKALRFYSNVNPVYSQIVSNRAVWANPDFPQIAKFLKFFLKAYENDASKTSLTIVVPLWTDKPWWAYLHRLRVLDIIPKGSDLFSVPTHSRDGDSNVTIHKGPTLWHTLVLYLGAEYHPDRLWKVTQGARSYSSLSEYQRLRLVKNASLVLSGDALLDTHSLAHLLSKIQPTVKIT